MTEIPMFSVADLLRMMGAGVLTLGFISVSAMFLIWAERKVSAHIQSRLGPMRVGWHGAWQSIADVIKLLLKEDIMPAGADRRIWWLAPFVACVPAVAAFVAIPFGRNLIIKDLNVGVLYVIAMGSIGVLGIMMAGWGSNNKYSLLGGMRSVAQVVSYEVPLLISVVTVLLYTHSLSMQTIVGAQQKVWFIFYPNLTLSFLIYMIAATAEVNRAPFDIPEAESELVAGFHTEYSGMKFAMFFVAEYTNLFIVSGLAATLFLGGWQGPVLAPIFWFFIKTYALIFILMWVRWTFPRVRSDQLMGFAWKVLTPLALLNLAWSGALLLLKA